MKDPPAFDGKHRKARVDRFQAKHNRRKGCAKKRAKRKAARSARRLNR